MSLKAAIYCRLSEEDKNKQSEADDSGSIQNQKAILEKYASDNRLPNPKFFFDDSDILGPSQKVLIKRAFL